MTLSLKTLETVAKETTIRGVLHIGSNLANELEHYKTAEIEQILWFEAEHLQVTQLADDSKRPSKGSLIFRPLLKKIKGGETNQSALTRKLRKQSNPNSESHNTQNVLASLRTIDNLINESGVDRYFFNLATITTKDAKLSVLQGMTKQFNYLDFIFIKKDEDSSSLEKIESFLKSHDFEKSVLEETESNLNELLFAKKNRPKNKGIKSFLSPAANLVRQELIRKVTAEPLCLPENSSTLKLPSMRVGVSTAPGEKTLFDIGANVGAYTYAHWETNAYSKIVCLEPNETAFKRLRERFAIIRHIIPICCAATPADNQVVTFYESDDDSALSSINLDWLEKPGFRFAGQTTVSEKKVFTVTIDKLIEIYGMPDLLKVDVEGYEETALKGLTQKVPRLCFEWAEEMSDECCRSVTYLATLGFTEYAVQHDDDYLYEPKTYHPVETFSADLLQTRIGDWGMVWLR